MKMTTLKRTLVGMLAATTLVASVYLPAFVARAQEANATYAGTSITEHIGGYEHYERKIVTHAADFSMTNLGFYAMDTAWAMDNRAAGEIVDGRLTSKDGMKFSFGTAECLGDNYGLEEGYLSFDIQLTGGAAYLGLRTSEVAGDSTDRGLWFMFDGTDALRITEPESGIGAKITMPFALTGDKHIEVHEALNTITLTCDGQKLAIIQYSKDGHLAICDGQGTVLKETSKSKLYPTGYATFYLDDIDGSIDNVVYTNVEMERNAPETDELRIIDYSTWTATDDLDRTVADHATAGDPNENRYVGVFYFLCQTGAQIEIYDNTKAYLEYGAKGIKAFIEERAGEAYWAEPYFGYYYNTDTWVYRKHAYMLEAAGVDFIYLDVGNGEVFTEGHMALFDTWLQMRCEGTDTPQIVFANSNAPATFDSNMRKLLSGIYSDENWDKYKELFFEWEGKPLVFGDTSTMGADIAPLINEKFTVRGCWAWADSDNYWNWIQEYYVKGDRVRLTAGGWGRNAEGKYESLAISMGHHPSMGKGRSYVNGKQPSNGLDDFEFSSIEQSGLGLGFASQFDAVQKLIAQNVAPEDPFVLMITGWNEWVAIGFKQNEQVGFAGTTSTVQYIDQFNPEFSRDGEPMRNQDGYGFGDNYYYQMVDYIRQYKGISATPTADHQGSINIYDLSSWDDIELTYMDTLYDTELRNERAYDNSYRNINNTGRNDFDSAKVSQDTNALYFLVTTTHDMVIDNGTTWMNLYLNTDGDTATGWEGYDYVLNRDRDSFVVTVEKFKDNTFETEVVGAALYYLEGDSMAIRLSKDLIGISGKADKLIFKWADNSVDNGDPMAFMDLGDTAPNDRFGFQYFCDDYTTSTVPTTTLVTESGEMRVNGTVITKPDTDVHITIKDTKVDISYDFDSFPIGQSLNDTVLAEQFEFLGVTADSTTRILNGDNGKYARMNGFSDLRTWSDVEGAYEFSLDLHMIDYGQSAVYIRGEMPGAYTPLNPGNYNLPQIFNYHEWDWYVENGGRTYGGSSTGGSGIGIFPGKNNITIRIKRYAEDGLGIASASYNFPYSADFKPSESGWFKLRVVDDGSHISIYFDDILMCMAKLENPGVVYESDGTGQQYYGKVTLMDATGKEVLAVENTRVNSSGSQLAITTRAQTIEFSNIYIAYAAQEAEGSRVETPIVPVTTTTAYTPDQSLLTTLSLGADAVDPDTTIDTTPPETAPETEGTTPSSSETDIPNEKERGCASVLGFTAMPVMMTLIGYALSKKRDYTQGGLYI